MCVNIYLLSVFCWCFTNIKRKDRIGRMNLKESQKLFSRANTFFPEAHCH